MWLTLVSAQSSNPSSWMMLSTFFFLSAVEFCFLGNRRFPENKRFSRTVRVPIRTSSYRRTQTDTDQRKCWELNQLNECVWFWAKQKTLEQEPKIIIFHNNLPCINTYMCHTTEQNIPLSSQEKILLTVKFCILTCTT